MPGLTFLKIIGQKFFFTLMISCLAQEDNKMKFKNKLANETSPYLLQHASNPVNWYPWGNEALDKAKSENKLVVISIGYAACHWCHVMEHESFEDTTVAKLMNDFFVLFKKFFTLLQKCVIKVHFVLQSFR